MHPLNTGAGYSCNAVANTSTSPFTRRYELGLVVNPHAGPAAGPGGLQRCATRIRRALTLLGPLVSRLRIVTGPGSLGQSFVDQAFPDVKVVGGAPSSQPSGEDTRRVTTAIHDSGVDLLLFAGGDGTARDVLAAVGDALPVTGLPTGNNMHSGVFAATPEAAGEIALAVLRGETSRFLDREVLGRGTGDKDRIVPLLFGYMQVPAMREYLPGAKKSIPLDDDRAGIIAAQIMDLAEPDTVLVFGAGGSTQGVMRSLGLEGTVQGVDVVMDSKLVASDVDEQHLLRLLPGRKVKLVVSPIGGQGFLLGRGTPQLGDSFLRVVGPGNVIVIAAREKLDAFRGHPLRLDLDDEMVVRSFPFSIRVLTGEGAPVLYPLAVFQG